MDAPASPDVADRPAPDTTTPADDIVAADGTGDDAHTSLLRFQPACAPLLAAATPAGVPALAPAATPAARVFAAAIASAAGGNAPSEPTAHTPWIGLLDDASHSFFNMGGNSRISFAMPQLLKSLAGEHGASIWSAFIPASGSGMFP